MKPKYSIELEALSASGDAIRKTPVSWSELAQKIARLVRAYNQDSDDSSTESEEIAERIIKLLIVEEWISAKPTYNEHAYRELLEQRNRR